MAAPSRSELSPLGRLRQFARGTRGRLLVASIALLVLSMLASLLLVRGVLVADVETRVDGELRQRVLELERFVGARAGEASSDTRVETTFDDFFANSVPARDEGLYTFVAGVPYLTNARPPAELTTDAALVASLRDLPAPRRGSVETSAGTAEFLAVPVREVDASGTPVTRGVFVAAQFPDAQLSSVDRTLTRIGLGLFTLLTLASAGAYVARRPGPGAAAAGHRHGPLDPGDEPVEPDPGPGQRRHRRARSHVQRDARPAGAGGAAPA